ncbi:MAG TPA: hypothetical protein VLH08_17355 [Acidobacteriota bacterium]|nr:hypothetical protein [Acidobacteriota bacterium]
MNNQPLQKTATSINLIWAALLASTIIYVILAFVLSRTGWKAILDPALSQVLMGIFLALSLIDVMVVSWLKKKSFHEELPSVPAGEAQRKFIVSRSVFLFALSEVPSILGLVTFFLSGNLVMMLVFWVLSFISFLTARPSANVLNQVDHR